MSDYQSLVLKSAALQRLWLQDNGLRIMPKFSSERRVPLCRLLRVECYGDIGQVKDGFCTLLKIAEQHIPVTFFDSSNQVCAQLYHPCPKTKPLALWLEHCFCEQACQDDYRNWLNNQHYALLAHLHITQGSLPTRQQLLQQQLIVYLKSRQLDSVFTELYQQGKRMLTVVLGEQLMAHGLAAGTSLRNKLFNDLHDLMEYWIQGDILQWLQRFSNVNDHLKRDFYSHQYNALSEKITLILTQLQEMLEQYALEQYHH